MFQPQSTSSSGHRCREIPTFFTRNGCAERTLTYINAGHHLTNNERICSERLDKGGLPLGIIPNYNYEVGEVTLEPGDVMVLYSTALQKPRTKMMKNSVRRGVRNNRNLFAKMPLSEITATDFAGCT